MSLWEAITWDTARAGGFTAYILLTLSVLLGAALASPPTLVELPAACATPPEPLPLLAMVFQPG